MFAFSLFPTMGALTVLICWLCAVALYRLESRGRVVPETDANTMEINLLRTAPG
jgi:hypothetical protein